MRSSTARSGCWPAVFSLSAFIVEVTGVGYPSEVLCWAPPVLELLYLAPLRVIAQAVGVGTRAGWLGTLLFFLSNWIARYYFLPQALNVLFYLVVLAAVLAFWRPLTAPGARRLRRLARWVVDRHPERGERT